MVKYFIAFLFILGQFSAAADDFAKDIRPLLERYCYKCHAEDVQKGDIRLDLAMTEDDVVKNRKIWLRTLEQLESEEMPPKKPFPSDGELGTMKKWFDKTLHHYDWSKIKNPGYVSLSRLTNEEYQNSVRDVLGVDFHKQANWVKDPEGDSGFTNDRDNLSISINSMTKYLKEAEDYIDGAFSYKQKAWSKSIDLMQENGKPLDLKYETNPHQVNMTFPYTGLYELTVNVASKGQPKSGMRVMLNGRKVFGATIEGEDIKSYKVPVFARKGYSILMLYPSRDDAALHVDERIKYLVSSEVLAQIRKASKNPPQLKVPVKYKNNKKVIDAFKKVNQVAKRAYSSRKAAEIYMSLGKMPDDLGPIQGLLKGSVPTNINNGRLAVLLGISTKQIFQKWKDETGEDFGADYATYRVIRDDFRAAYNKQHGHKKEGMGRLLIKSMKVSGPFLPKGSQNPANILSKNTSESGAEKILSYYAKRAFRRNVSATDIAPFMNIYKQTYSELKDRDQALRDALISVFISPKFLMHSNFVSGGSEVGQYQLASRMAYFLWQTTPDRELLSLASKNALNQVDIQQVQIKRMVTDERFLDFCKSFTAEWLDLNNIQGVSPLLEKAMLAEPQLLMKRIFTENRNVFELINADYTYLNELLAKHYDIAGVKGQSMRLVPLNTAKRGGLLTMGSMLSATSLPSRTSPVQRGSWIVETILGEELPPPPDGVPELPANAGKGKKTLRQELEVHRQDPKCSGCHDRIDPYGFVLENYDKIGRWRDKSGKKKIDSKMTLKSGEVCNDVIAFKEHLLKVRKEDIRRNLVERTLSFALGRKLMYYDEPAIQTLIEKLKANKDKSHTLLEGIISSFPFGYQKIQEEE
ncbi:MAG: DUF1588 domain-containing protein [Lentisphaeraceae bacterium]|nr:DUF1588 domain-containing protein [Lentisphaeraceae bacterium]